MKQVLQRVRKSIRDCDWMKKVPDEFFMQSILSENLSKYEKKGCFTLNNLPILKEEKTSLISIVAVAYDKVRHLIKR